VDDRRSLLDELLLDLVDELLLVLSEVDEFRSEVERVVVGLLLEVSKVLLLLVLLLLLPTRLSFLLLDRPSSP